MGAEAGFMQAESRRRPMRRLSEKRLSRGFWVFFAAAFFFDLGFAVYFFLFNLYLLDLGYTERAMGWIGGAFTLGSVAGTLPAGWLARRMGLRPLLVACFCAAPIFGAGRAVATREPAQICLGFFAGLAMCLWGVCFLPAVARLTSEENRASAFSLIFSVSIGSSALGGAVCGLLPKWLAMAGVALQAAEIKRILLLASCGIAVVGVWPVLMLRLPLVKAASEDEKGSGDWRGWLRLFGLHPFLLRFLPVMALWSAVLVSFTPFANVYLSREMHLSLARVGVIFSVSQGVQFCAGLLTPWLFGRVGLARGVVATQVATALAMGCLACTQDSRLAVALYLSLSATQWMSSPGLYNLAMSKVSDGERSTAAAMTMFSNAVLQSIAVAGAGILFARFGYPRVLAGLGGLALACAALFEIAIARADRRAKRRVAAEASISA